jgi:ABC-type polysaccharide/polyol phosphate export permease
MQTESEVPIYDTANLRPQGLIELVQVWRYRDLILQLVRRDVTARYKRSVLGVAWTMLNPLGTMIILAVVFSKIFGRIAGYSAYILTGIVVWTFFSQVTNSGINAVVKGSSLFKRIYLPRTVFSISAVGTGLVNLFLSLIILFGVMLVVGVPIRPVVGLVFIPVFLLSVFSLGLSLLITSVGIFFPDIAEMYNIMLRAWFYFTPIIYEIDFLPEFAQSLIKFNPMYHLLELFRYPTYYGRLFSWEELLYSSVFAFGTLIIGWVAFAQISDQLAYRA